MSVCLCVSQTVCCPIHHPHTHIPTLHTYPTYLPTLPILPTLTYTHTSYIQATALCIPQAHARTVHTLRWHPVEVRVLCRWMVYLHLWVTAVSPPEGERMESCIFRLTHVTDLSMTCARAVLHHRCHTTHMLYITGPPPPNGGDGPIRAAVGPAQALHKSSSTGYRRRGDSWHGQPTR